MISAGRVGVSARAAGRCALAITLTGPWISRRTAGWISTLTTFTPLVR